MPRPAASLAAVLLTAAITAQSGWVRRWPQTTPQPREFHALTYDLLRGKTVMFGGWNGLHFADTWEWDGVDWTPRAPVTSPPARAAHALAFDLGRNRVVLFGGWNGPADLDDTWEYDGMNWMQQLPANRPGPRRDARMAYDLARSRVLLFGGGVGSNGSPVFGDTWHWDGTDWTLLIPSASPPARWAHAMTHDHARAIVVLTGGTSGGTQMLANNWAWDGTTWTQLPSLQNASMHAGIAHDTARDVVIHFFGSAPFNPGDTLLFDGQTWRPDLRSGGPLGRAPFTLAYDVLRSRAVMFSRLGSAFAPETWEYDSTGMARWTRYGAGCASAAGTPLLRPASTSLPVLGTTFTLELLHLGTGVGAITIGFSDQLWNAQPLPLDLGSFGMPGCTLHASPDFVFFVPITAGTASLAWSLPNDPGLVGVRFFDQGFVLAPGANPTGAIVSNAGAGVIGSF